MPVFQQYIRHPLPDLSRRRIEFCCCECPVVCIDSFKNLEIQVIDNMKAQQISGLYLSG